MSDICNPRYYSIYDFPPPDMRKGCEAFINVLSCSTYSFSVSLCCYQGHEEIIERGLVERKGNADVEHYLCYTKTKAKYLKNIKTNYF